MLFKRRIAAICDDCGYYGVYLSVEQMRNLGWAIARNRINCYCMYCAFRHRHTGCKSLRSNEMVSLDCNHSDGGDFDA